MPQMIAIDCGSTTVRAVWLRGSAGHLEVVRALAEPAGEGALGRLMAQLEAEKVPRTGLTLGVPGQAATLRYNLLPPVPEWRLELILKYETQELSDKSGEALTYDYCRLDVPESRADDQILLMALGKDSNIAPRIQEVEAAKGRISYAVPSAIGLYHAYRQATRGPLTETVLLTDVGAQETHIVLVAEGRLLFARSVSFGGDQIDESVAGALDVKVEAARKIKEGMRDGRNPGGLAENAQPAMRSALGQLFSILQSSINFCRAQIKVEELNLDRVLVSGGSAALPQLATFLQERFHVAVEPLRLPVRDDLPGGVGTWVTAIGLAASQLARPEEVLDLLPPAARVRREFLERTRYLIGSAAVAALSILAIFAVGWFVNSKVNKDTESIDAGERGVARLEAEYKAAEQDNDKVRAKQQRVQRELLGTRFTAAVLAALREHAPAEIAIEKVALDRTETQDDQFVYELKLDGAADDSERQAVAHVARLKSVLERLPLVKRVTTDTSSEIQHGRLPFTLVVSPDPAPPKKKERRG